MTTPIKKKRAPGAGGSVGYKPTDADRQKVRTMSGMGTTQAELCELLGMSPKTLRRHFRAELDTATIEANARVAQSLFKMATSGDPKAVVAAIFWLKTRAGWKEQTPVTIDAQPIAITFQQV